MEGEVLGGGLTLLQPGTLADAVCRLSFPDLLEAGAEHMSRSFQKVVAVMEIQQALAWDEHKPRRVLKYFKILILT